MERKIGEIFEYNGKKYKVEADAACERCAFFDLNCGDFETTRGSCTYNKREDKTSVIFTDIMEAGTFRFSEKSILEEAIEILNGSRQCDYGDPVESFKRIAQLANLMSNSNDFTPVKCCIVMIASKLTRESHKHKRDNLVDLCGYGAIMNRIIESETKE